MFEAFAHLIAAFDNFGFALWGIGSAAMPAQFDADPKVLRSLSFRTTVDRWPKAFPRGRANQSLRAINSDGRLEALRLLRNISSHRASLGPLEYSGSFQIDGRYFFPIKAIDGQRDFVLGHHDLPDVARWACKAIDGAALLAADDLAEPLSVAIGRVDALA